MEKVQSCSLEIIHTLGVEPSYLVGCLDMSSSIFLAGTARSHKEVPTVVLWLPLEGEARRVRLTGRAAIELLTWLSEYMRIQSKREKAEMLISWWAEEHGGTIPYCPTVTPTPPALAARLTPTPTVAVTVASVASEAAARKYTREQLQAKEAVAAGKVLTRKYNESGQYQGSSWELPVPPTET